MEPDTLSLGEEQPPRQREQGHQGGFLPLLLSLLFLLLCDLRLLLLLLLLSGDFPGERPPLPRGSPSAARARAAASRPPPAPVTRPQPRFDSRPRGLAARRRAAGGGRAGGEGGGEQASGSRGALCLPPEEGLRRNISADRGARVLAKLRLGRGGSQDPRSNSKGRLARWQYPYASGLWGAGCRRGRVEGGLSLWENGAAEA